MEESIKDEYLATINLLKEKRTLNRKDIAKVFGEECHNGYFKAKLSYLTNSGYLNHDGNSYTITQKGDALVSLDKIEENETWQIRLAKSNIEANEFQKTMSKKNHAWMVINVVSTLILMSIAAIQGLLKVM